MKGVSKSQVVSIAFHTPLLFGQKLFCGGAECYSLLTFQSSSLNLDAIGDRANSILLSVYSRLLQDLSARSDLGPSHELDLRLRIEHAQILRKEDVIKLHELGVIASMQPTHCTSDMSYVETRIGKRRAKEGAYVWGDLVA